MERTNKGFTLIELLLVIVIIGVLAGLVIAVINPTRQSGRAKEGTARSNMAKVCEALTACMSSQVTPDVTDCVNVGSWSADNDEFDRFGTIMPNTPSDWTYQVRNSTGGNPYVAARTYGPGGTDGNCYLACYVYADFRLVNVGSYSPADARPGQIVHGTNCVTE